MYKCHMHTSVFMGCHFIENMMSKLCLKIKQSDGTTGIVYKYLLWPVFFTASISNKILEKRNSLRTQIKQINVSRKLILIKIISQSTLGTHTEKLK
jgi:hypothetical protein